MSHVIPKKHTGALMKRRALKGEGHEGCQVEGGGGAVTAVEVLSLSQLGLWQPCVAKAAFQGRFCHLLPTWPNFEYVFSIKFLS